MTYAARPMGDFKTGGYGRQYMGDPGFLSSLWKGIKRVAPAIIGGLVGGPAGAIIGAAGGATKPTLPAIPGTVGGAVTFPGGTQIGLGFQPGAMIPGRGRLPPFTATGAGVIAGGGRGGAMIPSGYHFAKDGSGRLVRNRRMNVANPRALRRSMRRVQGFEKLAKRTIQFTRRVKMKKRRSS